MDKLNNKCPVCGSKLRLAVIDLCIDLRISSNTLPETIHKKLAMEYCTRYRTQQYNYLILECSSYDCSWCEKY